MNSTVLQFLQIILYTSFLFGAGILYYRYALKKNILDIPSERSSHEKPTVRGGGIIFFIAIWTAILYAVFHNYSILLTSFPAFVLGFIILGFLGFLDDKKGLTAAFRFPFQIFAVWLIIYGAGICDSGFHWTVKLLFIIVSLGFVNAYNFMDGINGITGLYSLVVVLSFMYLNFQIKIFPAFIFYTLVISLLVFGYFNFRKKALMFAGDIGSMSLAAVLLFIISVFIIKLKSPVLLLFVLIYGIDSAMTIIFRLLKHQNIFKAHRWHYYQKLVDKYGFSHMATSAFYALAQAIINFSVIYYKMWEWPVKEQFFVLAGFLIIFASLYIIVQKDKFVEKDA
jgi:UDP-N-acetylmuramyl pentapeptide phosphotransferase/UDP-N-acetylglucosamine-1-phosphate transferase